MDLASHSIGVATCFCLDEDRRRQGGNLSIPPHLRPATSDIEDRETIAMAYGVMTRMYLAPEPDLPGLRHNRPGAVWRQLQADERLKAVERQLLTRAR